MSRIFQKSSNFFVWLLKYSGSYSGIIYPYYVSRSAHKFYEVLWIHITHRKLQIVSEYTCTYTSIFQIIFSFMSEYYWLISRYSVSDNYNIILCYILRYWLTHLTMFGEEKQHLYKAMHCKEYTLLWNTSHFVQWLSSVWRVNTLVWLCLCRVVVV